jgi:hypothetical protein
MEEKPNAHANAHAYAHAHAKPTSAPTLAQMPRLRSEHDHDPVPLMNHKHVEEGQHDHDPLPPKSSQVK